MKKWIFLGLIFASIPSMAAINISVDVDGDDPAEEARVIDAICRRSNFQPNPALDQKQQDADKIEMVRQYLKTFLDSQVKIQEAQEQIRAIQEMNTQKRSEDLKIQ